MITLLIQLLISLALSSLIVFTIVLVLTKRSLMKCQVYLESFLEIIPRDAVSHSDRDVVEPERLDLIEVRISQFIR